MGKPDGGPAFPCSEAAVRAEVINTRGNLQINQADQMGMTLRDWFAGQALAGLIGCHVQAGTKYGPSVCEEAYLMADAMLSERAK